MASLYPARIRTIGPGGLYWEHPAQRTFPVEPVRGDVIEIARGLVWEITGRLHRRDGALVLDVDNMGADETTLRGLDFQPAPSA